MNVTMTRNRAQDILERSFPPCPAPLDHIPQSSSEKEDFLGVSAPRPVSRVKAGYALRGGRWSRTEVEVRHG